MGEQSLAPEWLSLHKELPSSSQDKVIKPPERERPRRFNKQNSYHHLTPASHAPSQHHLAPSSSPNWRHSDANPRILNRSKSSPGFELDDVPLKSPKSPDRTNSVPVPNERNFSFMRSSGGVKNKFKPKPTLMSSMSSPNLFASDKASSWLHHQKMGPTTPTRSPPVSRSNSALNISITVPPVPTPTPAPVIAPVAPLSPSTHSLSLPPEDLEMEKLRILVPSAAVIPTPKPTRLVEPGNRKGAHPKVGERPKKVTVTLPPPLKKATSETALLSVDELRRAKVVSKADKTKVKLMEIVEEKEKVVARRGAFFMDVIKREQQLQDGAEEVSDEGRDAMDKEEAAEGEGEGESEEVMSHRLGQSAPAIVDHRRSPPAVEDEERFLRELGWKPEEEDHVPELEEEEIAEMRLKIHGRGGSPVSPPHTHRFDVRRDLVVSIHQD